MNHAICIDACGGPEVMQWREVAPGPLAPDSARVRHEAVGLNFIDVYFRSGRYPLQLPSGLGLEGAGVVTAVGANVVDLRAGDRVAYAGGAPGAYAEERDIAADRLVRLPDSIDCRSAAAMMLQGMTAQYLLRRTYPVKAGDTILIHAAAGGVGLIVCQWAKALGATVIGAVGSEAKAELAHAHGCDHPVIYTREDLVARVRDITGGEGVPVVYDSVGGATFNQSLDCLRPLGMMVTFGQSSGPTPPVDTQELSKRGSLFLTRPTLFTYTAKREDLVATANDLFEVIAAGKVRIAINQTYPLREAAQAHRDLEARRTTGSTILLPQE